ncbi:unnamed protein product [Ectocarpus sp. 8 AP-2014]
MKHRSSPQHRRTMCKHVRVSIKTPIIGQMMSFIASTAMLRFPCCSDIPSHVIPSPIFLVVPSPSTVGCTRYHTPRNDFQSSVTPRPRGCRRPTMSVRKSLDGTVPTPPFSAGPLHSEPRENRPRVCESYATDGILARHLGHRRVAVQNLRVFAPGSRRQEQLPAVHVFNSSPEGHPFLSPYRRHRHQDHNTFSPLRVPPFVTRTYTIVPRLSWPLNCHSSQGPTSRRKGMTIKKKTLKISPAPSPPSSSFLRLDNCIC